MGFWKGGWYLYHYLFITASDFRYPFFHPPRPIQLKDLFITRFDAAANEDIGAIQDEIEKYVYEAGKSIWDQLAPPLRDEEKPSDLHSILYPEPFSFLFITNNGKADLIPEGNENLILHDSYGMNIVNDMGLPQYSSRDIRVLEILARQSYVTKVLVDGREICCKSGDDWLF